MTTAPASTAPASINRQLPDGASYTLTAAVPGTTTLYVHDNTDDEHTCTALDRQQVRQLIEDLQLVAGLTATASRLPLEQALIGSARRLFERIAELDKMNPEAAARIAAAIACHLRASRPVVLLAGGVM